MLSFRAFLSFITEAADLMVYHGTTRSREASIRAHGLTTATARATWDWSDAGMVYVTTSRRQADEWALDAARNEEERRYRAEGGEPRPFRMNAVVLTIRIPGEFAHLVQPDPHFNDPVTNKQIARDIPASWIVG